MGFVFCLRLAITMVYCEWKVMFLQVDVEVHRCWDKYLVFSFDLDWNLPCRSLLFRKVLRVIHLICLISWLCVNFRRSWGDICWSWSIFHQHWWQGWLFCQEMKNCFSGWVEIIFWFPFIQLFDLSLDILVEWKSYFVLLEVSRLAWELFRLLKIYKHFLPWLFWISCQVSYIFDCMF